jgi:hypothetical protein
MPSASVASRWTLDEFERVHSDTRTFSIMPGHEHEAIERVVGRTDRYAVVEKLE